MCDTEKPLLGVCPEDPTPQITTQPRSLQLYSQQEQDNLKVAQLMTAQ